MLAIIYRWRIKDGFEDQFVASWSEITEFHIKNNGSLGSRLHRGSDGLWYAYAQWKSARDRENAMTNAPDFPARNKMKESVEEAFPEILLETVSDFLILPEVNRKM